MDTWNINTIYWVGQKVCLGFSVKLKTQFSFSSITLLISVSKYTDMITVTIQSNKIVSNKLKGNKMPLEPSYRKKQTFWPILYVLHLPSVPREWSLWGTLVLCVNTSDTEESKELWLK